MIKAVTFDFYETIVTFDPPREELQVRACREFGVQVDPEAIPRAYWVADDFLSRENARLPIQKRPPEEAKRFWADYEATLLREAEIDVSPDVALRIVTRLRQLDRRLRLFDDVLPVLDALKARGMLLALISNLSRPLDGYCSELGLTRYIDLAITSSEVGFEKPHPEIFLAALERAEVSPSDAAHVGDQYHSDVTGARGAGISPVLLDRHGFWTEFDDCPRIRTLSELVNLV
jgi:HAD superfamily hydrolase (TIGR01549 family)